MAWDKIGEYLVASGLPSLLLGTGLGVVWKAWMNERKEHKLELAAAQAETKAANASRIQDLHELLKPND